MLLSSFKKKNKKKATYFYIVEDEIDSTLSEEFNIYLNEWFKIEYINNHVEKLSFIILWKFFIQ